MAKRDQRDNHEMKQNPPNCRLPDSRAIKKARIRRENFGSNDDFWQEVEVQHLRICGRPPKEKNKVAFHTHYEGKPTSDVPEQL